MPALDHAFQFVTEEIGAFGISTLRITVILNSRQYGRCWRIVGNGCLYPSQIATVDGLPSIVAMVQ